MPKLVAEVKASHFHRTGKDSQFVIHKMKSGEIRTDAAGRPSKLSFRARNERKSDGPLGIPNEDWAKIIGCFTGLYGIMVTIFIVLIMANNGSSFGNLYAYLGIFLCFFLGIVYVSVEQYQRTHLPIE